MLTMLWSCRKKGGACLQWFGHVERKECAYNALVMWKEGKSVLTMIWSCRKKGGACLQWFGHVERREERALNGLVM